MGRPVGRPRVHTGMDAPMTVAIKGDMAVRLREYMIEHGHSAPTQAVREILTVYFASAPIDGAVRSARDNALNNTKHWLLSRITVTLQELQQEIEAETAAIERSGYGH